MPATKVHRIQVCVNSFDEDGNEDAWLTNIASQRRALVGADFWDKVAKGYGDLTAWVLETFGSDERIAGRQSLGEWVVGTIIRQLLEKADEEKDGPRNMQVSGPALNLNVLCFFARNAQTNFKVRTNGPRIAV